MRRFCIAVVAFVTILGTNGAAASMNSDFPNNQVLGPPASDTVQWGRALRGDTNQNAKKRLLRVADTHTEDANSTHNTPSTRTNASPPSVPESDDEERAVKLPTSLTKDFKSKKILTVITNLFTSNKKKMTPAKLRVKMLEKLQPEIASKLIFLKAPKRFLPPEVPKRLPSRLPAKIKAQVFNIPGVEDLTIRQQMEVWFFYRLPPTYAFKKLGLVGKGWGDVLHKQPNYKYYKAYFDAWYKDQQHLIF
ncbi:unnamed protein product [Phytophthora lilii]|uniref:RxLR effector protein n=1 Tax=Phytophthora lilii TaxID=2077276 RepID=A0A9W6TEH2_9STRA|nr:unnamed protein product [Phytophthora lilii]